MPGLDSAGGLSARPSRRVDLAIGVVLGIVLGIAIVSAFVFLGSEGSVDAPRVSGRRQVGLGASTGTNGSNRAQIGGF